MTRDRARSIVPLLVLALLGAPVLSAKDLPTTAPEAVGLSAERLERLTEAMQAYVDDGRLAVQGQGDETDWWRAAAVAGWAHLDATGDVASTGDLVGPPTPVSR